MSDLELTICIIVSCVRGGPKETVTVFWITNRWVKTWNASSFHRSNEL